MARNNRRRQKAAEKEAVEQESFFEKHLRLIAGIAVVIVLVVVAIVLARIFINKRGAKAELALFPCEQYFQQGNYEKALEGDGQQCDGFLTVASQYSMTKAGNLAKLYAGVSYAQLGKYDEAKQYLEKFSPKKDEMISPAALGALGNTYVQLGEQEKGAETLVKAAKKADNTVLSPLFLVQAGEVYEALGNVDKALELYELVKSHYRSSVQGSEIDKYIERAKSSK
ncbi:MAG: tetratricopeptide repeat protein [Prevotellaceae bacterium]|nr:tetratricopeptide repeat protein [Prevotellaceae bacterium]